MAIKEINGKWYAYEIKNNNVLSIGKDNPKQGRWSAPNTDKGILYVATPSPNKRSALAKSKRANA